LQAPSLLSKYGPVIDSKWEWSLHDAKKDRIPQLPYEMTCEQQVQESPSTMRKLCVSSKEDLAVVFIEAHFEGACMVGSLIEVCSNKHALQTGDSRRWLEKLLALVGKVSLFS
jgi:hypothetical protein